MSVLAPFKQTAALLAGRWQVPLAIVAAGTAVVTVYTLTPAARSLDFDSAISQIQALERAGRLLDATDAAGNLLELDPPLPPVQRGRLHTYLSEAIYRQQFARELSGRLPNLDNVRAILTHGASAAELGVGPDADAAVRAGRAHEWLSDIDGALREFRAALQLDPAPDTRREAMRELVRLLEGREQDAAERSRWLHALLSDEGVSPSYLWWGLQHALAKALDQGDALEARRLLATYGGRLKSSDLKGYHEYLEAWVLFYEGRYEEAEPLVRWIHDWLEGHDDLRSRLDGYGHLPALNRCLLGEIHLANDRPQEALAAFEEARRLDPDKTLFAAATVGRGRALAQLERHDGARQVFRDAVAALQADRTEHPRATGRFRSTLLELFRERDDRRDHDNAIGYLSLAAELTPPGTDGRLDLLEQLGQLQDQAAADAQDPEIARQLHLAAARNLEEAARLAAKDWDRTATLTWSAAQQYDGAGEITDARRLLEAFVQSRSADPRLPQALLQLGQAYEADGLPEEAVDRYARLIAEFPKLEEAARAKALMAGALLQLGDEQHPAAERLLTELLESDNITPDAGVFREALRSLCELYYHDGRYAEAIARLEELLRLYPDDAARGRTRFLLADAYRRSAIALRQSPPADSRADRVDEVIHGRLERAAELFGALYDEFQQERADADTAAAPPAGEAAHALYERLALFHRGDCLVELGDADARQRALAVFREASARYKGQPPALTAQVQIANIYLRMGRVTEAARAVERARWLLRSISDDAFAQHGDGTDRPYWDQYLATIASSRLFRDVLAGSP